MNVYVPPFKLPSTMDDIINDPVRKDGSVMFKSNFNIEITETQWKKYFVMAILRVIHGKENLEPECHTFYSINSLEHIMNLQRKIWRGLKSLTFGEVYDTWQDLMSQAGLIHSSWNGDDCDFVKRMLSADKKNRNHSNRNHVIQPSRNGIHV